MPRLIDPNDIHTAAATWSGFIYQGKVALYHVLHLLNTDQNALNYSLQLDSLEDFAIITHDANGEIVPKTLHQVKAMKSNRYSAYQEAFEKLEKRLLEFFCDGAFFHVSTQNERSAAEIKGLHPTIDLYVCRANPYCRLDEIDTACNEQIELFLTNNNLRYYINDQNVSILRNILESLICNQVIAIHAANHQRNGLTISEGAYYFTIPFQNFRDILIADPAVALNDNYYLYVTKELMNHYYLEFCHDIEEEEEISEEDKNKLATYLMQINGLDNASIINFIKSIIPHREVKLKTLRDFKDYNIQRDEFKDTFFQILYELIASKGKIGNNLTWNDADGFTYTATAINSPGRQKSKICKRIYENITQTDIDVPYESDKLITTELEVDSIEDELNNQVQVASSENVTNNITRWSKISLTTLENAKNNIV